MKLGCCSCGFLFPYPIYHVSSKARMIIHWIFSFLLHFYKMSPKKLACEDTCTTFGRTTNHLRRHILRIHVPWFMNPVTACVDCQTSEGCGKQLNRFFMAGISREALIQAWIQLMIRLFIFIYERLDLGSFTELLEYMAAIDLSATPLRFSEEE